LNYTAWLFDEDAEDGKGQAVDSGADLEFILGGDQVIPAFDLGVVGMRVAGLRELSIPPGFVGNGAGVGNIPPDVALVANVEMVDIQPLRSDTAPFTIIDLEIGGGLEARAGDTLRVAYSGWLFDNDAPENKGTLFEMSPPTGLAFTLGQGDVIEGWELGILGMRVGGTRRLIVPPELAVGHTSQITIPGDSTLVFDIQLLQILG
ncbi:MAG: FKBP-type peptidyl-prolyl cis-trans isomerase, partial [Acidobacteriota bacterium]|nr:FKBP-type peptidyl-prolyl cis-trans isomerase [Acidobacteriota bacterium]